MLSWITRTISGFKCVTRVEPQCAVERTRGGDTGISIPVRERQRSAETTAGVSTFKRPRGDAYAFTHLAAKVEAGKKPGNVGEPN